MITLVYVTYFVFAAIVAISTSILLFKLNFTLATLIVGFSVLAYAVRVWGNFLIIKKREELFVQYQTEQAKKQQEELFTNQPINTKGMN